MKRQKKRPVGSLSIVLLTAVAVLGGWLFLRGSGAATLPTTAYYVAKRGDLVISINEPGQLKAVSSSIVRNRMTGEAGTGLSRILYLKPEGDEVKRGDKLVELDASALKDQINSLQVIYEEGLLTYELAVENVKLQKSQIESDLRDATLNVVLAQSDLEKYREGDAPEELRSAEANVLMLKDDLQVAATKSTRTRELTDMGFATESSAETDALGLQRKKNDVERAAESVRLLKTYDQPTQLRQFVSSYEEAVKTLDRLKESTAAQLRQADSDLKTASDSLDVLDRNLTTRKAQYDNAIIYAPQDGLVVYSKVTRSSQGRGGVLNQLTGNNRGGRGGGARGGGGGGGAGGGGAGGGGGGTGTARRTGGARNVANALTAITTAANNASAGNTRGGVGGQGGPQVPSATVIEEGAMVRNQQALIELPDVSRMLAEVKVPEDRVRQVAIGQPAVVRVDTLPGRSFQGRVTKVAVVADSQAAWENPNRKVYPTEVLVEEQIPVMKPGVTARAEIIINILVNVISVPIQAVIKLQDRQVCYVWDNGTTKEVPVTVGAYNDAFIEVLTGLSEGDRVLLAAPIGAESEQNQTGPSTNAVATPSKASAGTNKAVTAPAPK